MEYKDFENALARLESIVGELEKGELALEEALKLFEEGIKISRFCNAKLDEAERKVEILLKNEKGQLTEGPFQLEREREKA
ncbi:exodeoxyribonuclease VII small subunit [Acidobacteria bacterium AH-259-A15]|nr:exodeoxyribonuclease VII small subunit [Acidobacteria bacterium AH-259-A15]